MYTYIYNQSPSSLPLLWMLVVQAQKLSVLFDLKKFILSKIILFLYFFKCEKIAEWISLRNNFCLLGFYWLGFRKHFILMWLKWFLFDSDFVAGYIVGCTFSVVLPLRKGDFLTLRDLYPATVWCMRCWFRLRK